MGYSFDSLQNNSFIILSFSWKKPIHQTFIHLIKIANFEYHYGDNFP